MNDFAGSLIDVLGEGRVKLHEPLCDYTTFHVGGPADWFVETRSSGEIIDILRLASELVVDAVITPGELRMELIARFAAAASRDRHFSTRRHGVPPV